jgi:hypothetical protein
MEKGDGGLPQGSRGRSGLSMSGRKMPCQLRSSVSSSLSNTHLRFHVVVLPDQTFVETQSRLQNSWPAPPGMWPSWPCRRRNLSTAISLRSGLHGQTLLAIWPSCQQLADYVSPGDLRVELDVKLLTTEAQ